MELIRDIDALEPRWQGGVLSVGVFDGVHRGHQKVLGTAVERAGERDAHAIVFTFHPHPLEILRPEEAPPLVQTFGQKLEMLRRLGVDAVVWPEDTEGVLSMTPETFIKDIVCERLAAALMVEGQDFRFGAGERGTVKDLRQLAAECGIEIETVPDLEIDGRRVSSTRIRRAIADGDVKRAARLLGRPYIYVGTVVEGHHRGARLGYPTVNLQAPRFLKPGAGVYAGWARAAGARHGAAISVGTAPTFDAPEETVVEAYLLDFEGELYGSQVRLEFIEYLRPQQAFKDVADLRAKMADDCRRVREVLSVAR